MIVWVVQDAQTIVVVAANQIAKSAFFMFSPLKTIWDAIPSIAKSLPGARLSIGKPPIDGCPKSWQAQSVSQPKQ
jgi:hypothetical protein